MTTRETPEPVAQTGARFDAEIVGAILFDRVDADELGAYVRYLRAAVEAELRNVQRADTDSGDGDGGSALDAYVASLEERLRATEVRATFDTEDRALLADAAKAARCLEAELHCFRQLERCAATADRLVVKVTFFYFLSCSRALQRFVYAATHPERPSHRCVMPPLQRGTFKPGLKRVAERYANREIDGAAFLDTLRCLYTFGSTTPPPDTRSAPAPPPSQPTTMCS